MGWAAAIVVLSARGDHPDLQRFDCPPGLCERAWVSDTECAPEETVVVAGHSRPPEYLGVDAATLAEAVACHEPSLVVLDTCYGFSLPLLEELERRGVPLVVGSTGKLPIGGLVYEAAFFTSSGERAAAAVGGSVVTWTLDGEALARARHTVAGWSVERLEEHLQRVWPNLVRAPLESEIEVLVPVGPERFRRASVSAHATDP